MPVWSHRNGVASFDELALDTLGAWFDQLGLDGDARPLRLRLTTNPATIGRAMMVQKIDITEAINAGLDGWVSCVSPRVGLPLKLMLGCPLAVDLLTDEGLLRPICGVVTEAHAGRSDGGFAQYHLRIRDAFSIMDQRVNSRVFRQRSVLDITRILFSEWRQRNAALASVFDYRFVLLREDDHPARDFSLQYNESDAAFLQRLWRREGLSWFIVAEPVSEDTGYAAAHVLVLFADSRMLAANRAGEIRYHGNTAVETHDSVTAWSEARVLVPGEATLSSSDYKFASGPQAMMVVRTPSILEQGGMGDQLAAALKDSRIERPRAGHDYAHYDRLSRARMMHHEYRGRQLSGQSGVRQLAVGEWNRLVGHPDLARATANERAFLITRIRHHADNNLPVACNDGPPIGRSAGFGSSAGFPVGQEDRRYRNQFEAIPLDRPLKPSWDPRRDLPSMSPLTAVVVGPPGEEVWCDEDGRIKIQLLGLDPADHEHAKGAGTSGTGADSAWVRVASQWASDGWGSLHLPRVGDEVVVDFIAGDPDRPIVTGVVFNGRNPPPRFSGQGVLPGDRYLSGTRSKEVFGQRHNQLRFDDTRGEISTQLSSDHAASQLNLGYLTHPRHRGDASPRGEGVELRTDRAASIRGGDGVLISAEARRGACGDQLDRDQLSGVVDTLLGVVTELARQAEAHRAGAAELERLNALAARLAGWQHGSNTDPGTPGDATPVVAISAPAGIALGSADSVFIASQTTTDIASAGAMQVSAGRSLSLRTAASLNAYSTADMKLVAAEGGLGLETHRQDIELISARRIVLSAAEEIVLQAPRIRQVSQGAQVDVGGGTIRQQCEGEHLVRSATFNHLGPAGGAPDNPDPVRHEAHFDQQVVLRWAGTHAPIPHQRYRIVTEDGRVFEGCSDANGLTERFESSLAFGRYRVEILTE